MDAYNSWFGLLWVEEWLVQRLVSRGNDFVQRKFQFSDEIVKLEILQIFIVITVVHTNFELLLLLEVVVHQNLGHPLWVQVVVNHLSLSNFLPDISLLSVENRKGVALGKGVHIDQFFA